MAKTFKIQNNPTFKATVQVPRVGSDDLAVTFEFKVVRRDRLGALTDKWREDAVAMFTKAKEEEWNYEKLSGAEIDLHATQVMDIVVGWGFEDKFNEENVKELCASSAFVLDAITEVYHEAFQRAKAGN